MLIIPISDEYRIERDSHSWQVSHWKTDSRYPEGGRYAGVRWYNTLQEAAESVQTALWDKGNAEGAGQVIEALGRASAQISGAIDRLASSRDLG